MSDFLENILICPNCKKNITSHAKKCLLKSKIRKDEGGIWNFVFFSKGKSQLANEQKHKQGSWDRIDDGSYEILAAFAKGNKTIDIACGDGYIEELAPQTVGVDFSISALNKAKSRGAKYLVCANAENLPFVDDAFEVSISAGSLENIKNPQKAILEMARVSEIQIMTIHREFNFPGARLARKTLTRLLNIKHQPVENPMTWDEVERMLTSAGLKIVFKGFWTLPVNYGKILPILPVLHKVPSCYFVISKKPCI